jgi:hypothetical protein
MAGRLMTEALRAYRPPHRRRKVATEARLSRGNNRPTDRPFLTFSQATPSLSRGYGAFACYFERQPKTIHAEVLGSQHAYSKTCRLM